MFKPIQSTTVYGDADWVAYLLGRPEYPSSLYNIIRAHHAKHGNGKWNRIVDIGSGIGVALTGFAEDFEVLHVSDPSASNLHKACRFLTTWMQCHGAKATLEFSQSEGEFADQLVGYSSSDMVICAVAAHFMDPDGLVQSASNMLRPGGTLAIFTYMHPSFPNQSRAFTEAYLDSLMSSIISSSRDNSKASSVLWQAMSRMYCGGGGQDNVPLPAKLLTKRHRYHINASQGEMTCQGKALKYLPAGVDLPPVRISPSEKIIALESGEDAGGDGWTFEMNKKSLFDFIATVGKPIGEEDNEEVLASYATFGKIFDEECPSGFTLARWPCKIAIGTRK
ncbi:hypothetical protein PV08_10002 [Exophiala spinifera]|uniref:Methyltransferase type 11 domain-containing protein n=1 Tax=Exophiala spinifera TaxID=91928 RepID=A0A0D2BNL5_9EURO|nr:uncharacterized protein PV08_10002 [Exophiala spinifera]KIW12724.1 hypothetical protein PV08_10002 [Exophiala spinifera]